MRTVVKVLVILFLVCTNFAYSAVITSKGSGNWNAVGTWVGGVVPTPTDDVIIASGNTVNLTSNQTCISLTLNGTGILNMNTAIRTLTITGNLTMNGTSVIQGSSTTRIVNVGGNFFVPASQTPIIQDIVFTVTGVTTIDGTLTLSTGDTASKTFTGTFTIGSTGTFMNTSQNVPITLGGSMVNNGTFNQGTGRVTFTGTASNTVTGTAATTAFGGGITVNKGTSQANVLDVQCIISMSIGGLTLTNGTFKLSSASTILPFTSNPGIAGFPATARLWCNGGTMLAGSNSVTYAGAIQVSAGTLNVGSSANQYLFPNGGSLTISGGALNVAGPLSADANGSFNSNGMTFNMSGGICTVSTNSNNTVDYPFYMNNAVAPGSSFTMSGGTLIIQNRSNYYANANAGYKNLSPSTVTGGTIQIGNSSTVSGSTIEIDTTQPIYNLAVNNSSNVTARIQSQAINVINNVTISSGTLNANNYDISLGGNWTNNGIFIPGTSTVTFNGSSPAQIIGGTNTTSFYGLALNNTASIAPNIMLGINATATDALTMTSGIVNLAGFTFTLGSTGAASTLIRTASTSTNWFYGGTFTRNWVAGTAITSTSGNFYGLFPVGAPWASSYRPLEINSTANPTASGTYSVTHTSATAVTNLSPTFSDAGTTVQRIDNNKFVGTISGVSGGTYSIKVSMTDLYNLGNLSDIRLAVSTGGTTASAVGTHVAATGAVSNPTAGRSGLSVANLSNDFRIATSNFTATPLPVELLSFNASLTKEGVSLHWTTASEINNDYFTVERSADGEKFEEVMQTKGKGNSIDKNYYETFDFNPLPGLSYYRLKQTDFDGRYSYSDVVAIENNSHGFRMSVFPNPTINKQLNVEFTEAPANSTLQIKIVNTQGFSIYLAQFQTDESGKVKAMIELPDATEGLYFVIVGNIPGLLQKVILK